MWAQYIFCVFIYWSSNTYLIPIHIWWHSLFIFINFFRYYSSGIPLTFPKVSRHNLYANLLYIILLSPTGHNNIVWQMSLLFPDHSKVNGASVRIFNQCEQSIYGNWPISAVKSKQEAFKPLKCHLISGPNMLIFPTWNLE